MPSADQVPVKSSHSRMRWHKWVVPIAGSTGFALRAVGPPNLHTAPDVRRDLVTPRVRRVPCSVHPWPSWPILAEKGQGTGKPHAGTIFNAVWLAPDATLSLAFGYQEFGLRLRPHGQKKPILYEDTLWRIPANVEPEKQLLPVRRLTEAQVALLETRRARKK